MLKVAAYTGGVNVPSSRFRVRQYIDYLKESGIDLDEIISQSGSFPPRDKVDRLFWAARTILEHVPRTALSREYDVTLLQREMISTFYTFERFTKKPRILDVDDAIFLNRDGDFAKKLAADCQHIICGNDYLANWFYDWNKSISIQATAVDTDIYKPTEKCNYSDTIVIGWIGTSSNLLYVNEIKTSLAQIVKMYPNVVIKVVSDTEPEFLKSMNNSYKFSKWTADSEIQAIQSFDIGIMPLKNTEIAKGKCSFKMLQYMSCGIPVIASPIGMNASVLNKGNFGFGPNSTDEWVDVLKVLVTDENLRTEMGRIGRETVVKNYSIDVIGKQFASVIKSMV